MNIIKDEARLWEGSWCLKLFYQTNRFGRLGVQRIVYNLMNFYRFYTNACIFTVGLSISLRIPH